MVIYENNMNVLKEKYPIIYEAIKDVHADSISDTVRIEDARKGGQVVIYNNNGTDIYLNSKYDPENEALKYMAETFELHDSALLFMYGLSNGYYIRKHIQHAKNNTRCIIFEPSKEVFVQVILHIDISDIIKSDKVLLILKDVNTEAFSTIVGKWLDMRNRDLNKIIAAPKYFDLFREGYEEFRQNCVDMYEKLLIITNTALDMGKKIAQNEIYNMLYLEGCRSGACLKNRFAEDMPAIVISAGPSLEKNMHLINEAKGKALIIAVDTATAKVMQRGIKPDAIISIDGEKPVDLFNVAGIDEIPFFAEIGTNSDVLEFVKPKDVFFISADSVIWRDMFEQVESEISDIESGLSVATEAIAAVISWGIKKIILIGQDLAFTDSRTYVGEEQTKFDEESWDYTHVKDIHGEEVLIQKDYYIYLKWMENIAAVNSDVEFIDATEGGAIKKNFVYMTFREAIDKYCTSNYDIENLLLSVPRLFTGEDKQIIVRALEKMKRDLRNMKKQFINCKVDCMRAKKILENGEDNVRELNRINSSIEKTVNMLEHSDERAFIYKWTVATEIDMLQCTKGEEDAVETAIRTCEGCVKYFGDLADAMPELIDIVENCILKLTEKSKEE